MPELLIYKYVPSPTIVDVMSKSKKEDDIYPNVPSPAKVDCILADETY